MQPVADSAIAAYQPTAGVSGAIVIAGSDTMQPILMRVAAAFKLWQPNIKIAIQGGGSDAGLRAFIADQATIRRGDAQAKGHIISGHVSLLASSRPLAADEQASVKTRYGFTATELPIALDAIVVYVNQQNPLRALTLEQVDSVFSASLNRGGPAITTWGQLGMTEAWAQQPIRLYGRDKRSGTRTMFLQTALLNGTLKPEVKEEPGSAMEILDLSRDLFGIGYAGSGFQASTVRALAIAAVAGETPVEPTVETVTAKTYALVRPLYLYAKRDPKAQLEPALAEFLRYVNSKDAQEVIARSGVYPISRQQTITNLNALQGTETSSIGLSASVQ